MIKLLVCLGIFFLLTMWFVNVYATVNGATQFDRDKMYRILRTISFSLACLVAFLMGLAL